MAFIDWLARKWAVSDNPPTHADLIFAVAHGSVRERPSKGLEAVVSKTEELTKRYAGMISQPFVAFGEFTYSGPTSRDVEAEFKLDHFPKGRFIGLVASTTEEAMKAYDLAARLPCDPRKIVIVTDESHSRRCRLIWQEFFPLAEIFIVTVPLRDVVERNSPMWAYRAAWRILLLNIALTPLFAAMKREQMEKLCKFHQPTF